MDENNKRKKSSVAVLIPVLLALICGITSVVYIVFRMLSNKDYEEKWKDYDECGL